jgi:aspartyl-tRNA(Asn)/glutamyl-tRNA(Gln) amidotransferase subunit A
MVFNKSIGDIINGYKSKEFSPVEIVKKYVENAKVLNQKLNALITITEELAYQQAKISEKKIMNNEDIGILEGIPISYKDNIDTKGIVTTSGSPIHKDRIPQSNAEVVETLEKEGAVNIGKTNMYEFAFGITSDNPFFGDIKNPWKPNVTAGGSSGGSAAAVAANLCLGSIGTDTAGSIRVPSSCCGVIGLKPTYNLISVQGIMPLSNSLDHAGPIAQSVGDLAIIMEAMTNKPFGKNCYRGIKGMKIGVPKKFFNERMDLDVKNSFHEALKTVENLGAILIEIPIPYEEDHREVAHILATSEVGFFHKDIFRNPLNQYSEGAIKTFNRSKTISAHSYIEGLSKRTQMTREITELFDSVDILITPTMPAVPSVIGLRELKIEGEMESMDECMIRYTSLFNITGHPAITIPCGLSQDIIPIGLQMIANHHREDLLIRAGYSFEQAALLDFYKRRKQISTI